MASSPRKAYTLSYYQIISFGIALLLVIFLFWIARISPWELFQLLQQGGPLLFLAITGIMLFQLLIQAISWMELLGTLDSPPSLFTAMKAILAGWSGNYLTPSMYLGGEPLRAYMLSKETKTPFSILLGSVLVHKFIELLSFLLYLLFSFFLVGFFYALKIYASFYLLFILSFSLLLLVFIAIFASIIKKKAIFSRLAEFCIRQGLFSLYFQNHLEDIQKMEQEIFNAFHQNRKATLLSLLWMLLFHFLIFIRPFLFMSFYHTFLSLEELALLFLALQFLQAFQFTPGGLGILEGGIIGLFAFMKLAPSLAIGYALLCRVGDIIIVALGIFSLFQSKGIHEEIQNKLKPFLGDNSMKQTPLNAVHKALGAKMVEFAGYEMPIQYTSIQEEHHRVRNKVGLFDLCHMGRIYVSEPGSVDFLQYLVTNNIAKMKEGQAHYALALNERGTILDDLIVYHLGDQYLVVCNGANREKIRNWFRQHSPSFEVKVEDRSDEMGMIAIQGVFSEEVVAAMVNEEIRDLKYYSCGKWDWEGETIVVARTGYTGEDGFELYMSNNLLEKAWNQALQVGENWGIGPVGLGARDTLRLEAAMPLYGHEITEETNPLEAGLGFAVKFKKGDFIGREALLKVKQEGLKRKLVCMEVEGRRIARQGAKILQGEEQVGEVSSGTFSPTLQKSIAMGYVPKEGAEVGNQFEVEIGKKRYPIRVVERPFYSRKKKKKEGKGEA